MPTFRFDDVSVNTDPNKLAVMVEFLRMRFSRVSIILAVSPAVHDCSKEPGMEKERVFPKILKVESDTRIFFKPDRVGVPDIIYKVGPVTLAGHGMIHLDHRLLSRPVQELSIMMCCSLVRSKMFIPPFHKWNNDTEHICEKNGVTLIKYTPEWRHLVYNAFDPSSGMYYLHTHDFTLEHFRSRFP